MKTLCIFFCFLSIGTFFAQRPQQDNGVVAGKNWIRLGNMSGWSKTVAIDTFPDKDVSPYHYYYVPIQLTARNYDSLYIYEGYSFNNFLKSLPA